MTVKPAPLPSSIDCAYGLASDTTNAPVATATEVFILKAVTGNDVAAASCIETSAPLRSVTVDTPVLRALEPRDIVARDAPSLHNFHFVVPVTDLLRPS